jgi:hypothetical protein
MGDLRLAHRKLFLASTQRICGQTTREHSKQAMEDANKALQ